MLRSRLIISALFALSLLLIAGCDRSDKAETPTQKASPDQAEEQERIPPTPPLFEDFQAKPVLSIFPRVGDYQPAPDDERHPFWLTFIDHLNKVSGLLSNREDGNKAWSFRSVNTIDSVAFFAPLKVEPATTYHVSYRIRAELPEDAKTGIGVLEFDEFLWDGEQYTEETTKKHLLRSSVGIELTGSIEWEERSFEFQTTPKTEMIHLVFYRDGAHSRDPVLIDDIRIEKVGQENQSKNNSH
ncbi:MAG: hypothetical protein C0615_02295 [Desulfuromonas sp.]|nr:MAG: hypothetical protein C0615_02295 [Desulfuromonas sp.]